MTWQFDVENAITTGDGAAWLYGFKVLMLSAGWVVSRSGNGTTGGAGDNIASITDLQHANSWMVLQRPDAGSEFCFSKVGSGDTRNWDILYSKGALFTGGSTTARATATDEASLITAAAGRWISGGNTTWSAGADDAAPYGFFLFGWPTSATTVAGFIVYDPIAASTFYPDDPDPYVMAVVKDYGSLHTDDVGDAADGDRMVGWTGATWGAIPGSMYADGYGTNIFPRNVGGNPYSGSAEDPIMYIPHGRSSVESGTSGWKGFGTVVMWVGVDRACKSTLTTATRSFFVFGNNDDDVCLPWPFQG